MRLLRSILKAINLEIQKEKEYKKAEQILKKVCKFYGMKKSIVLSNTRKHKCLRVKQVACFFMYENLSLNSSEIGNFLKYNSHSSVFSSCKVVRDMRDTNKDFELQVNKITQILINK